MMNSAIGRPLGALVTLSLGLAACAPQQAARPAAAPPASQMSLGGSAAPAQGASAAMQGHDMSSMDMQAMMAHCAELRGQVRQGAAMTPDLRRMIAQCDEMDRAHGAVPRR